ncbi:MAG: FMN-binding protein [Spirochaetales bacterium]|nr:FMN-binding protein [Spirochaetales bacterium]
MNQYAIAGGKTAGVCLAAFLLVVLAHLLTASAIERRGEREIYEHLGGLAPGRAFGLFTPVSGNDPIQGFYPAWYGPEKTESYIVAVQGTGYKGPLSLLVHCGANGEILAARLLKNQEIPGMGKNAETKGYMNKFLGTGATKPVPLDPRDLSPQDAEAVCGVSITFGGIARAIEKASAFIKAGGGRR